MEGFQGLSLSENRCKVFLIALLSLVPYSDCIDAFFLIKVNCYPLIICTRCCAQDTPVETYAERMNSMSVRGKYTNAEVVNFT